MASMLDKTQHREKRNQRQHPPGSTGGGHQREPCGLTAPRKQKAEASGWNTGEGGAVQTDLQGSPLESPGDVHTRGVKLPKTEKRTNPNQQAKRRSQEEFTAPPVRAAGPRDAWGRRRTLTKDVPQW